MIRALMILVALMVPRSASADTASDIGAAVKMWSPLSVAQVDHKVLIAIDQRRITSLIYQSLIISGVCSLARTNPDFLTGIVEVVVLNRFGAQGFVYETKEASCAALRSAPVKAGTLILLGATHLY